MKSIIYLKKTYRRYDFIINTGIEIVCKGNRQHYNSLGNISIMIYFPLPFYDNFPYQWTLCLNSNSYFK